MPTPTLNFLDPSAGLDQVKNYIIKLQRDLTFMLENLDELNINRLDAKVIVANTITADKMDVTELSAISANLGHITAGLIEAVTIIGSLIQTATSGQRIELSSVENLLKAINNAGSTLSIKPNVSGTPAIEYDNSVDVVKLFLTTGAFSVNTSTTSTDITIAAGKNINLNPAGGQYVNIPMWSMLRNASLGTTLQSELNNKANAFSGYTGSVSVVTSVDFAGSSTSSSSLNFSNGILTSVS